MAIKVLRQQVELLLQEYYRARYLLDLGRGQQDPQEIIAGFSLEVVQRINGAQGGNINYISGFAELLELEKLIKLPLHSINDEASAAIEHLYRIVADEEDRKKRIHLLNNAQFGTVQLNQEHLQTWVEQSAFKSSKDLFLLGLGMDIENLTQSIFRLLEGTEQIYRSKLQQALSSMVNVGTGHFSDLVHYFRGNIYDEFFPEFELIPTLEDTLFKMGINLHRLDNLSIVTRPGDAAAKRVACHPVLCPQEVYLVARPRGGYRDYLELLHGAGHALFYSYTDGGLPVEYRRLGDISVGEAYALLLENISREAGWVQEFFELEPLEEYLGLVGFERLFNLRLDACRSLRLLSLLGFVGDWDVTQVMGVEMPDSLLRLSPPQDFFALRRTRARMLAAQIRGHLVRSVGHSWYFNSQSGHVIRDLWRKGTSWDSEKLAQSLGFAGLCPETLITEVTGT